LLPNVALAFAEGSGNIINPDGSLVFILVLFMLFVFVMNRLLFRPIGRVLDKRQALTEGATNEARAAVRSYHAKLADYEATIRQARTARAKEEIERQAAAARTALETESRQMAETISRTVLGRTVGGGAD